MFLSPIKKDLTKRCCRTKFPLRSNFAAERGVRSHEEAQQKAEAERTNEVKKTLGQTTIRYSNCDFRNYEEKVTRSDIAY